MHFGILTKPGLDSTNISQYIEKSGHSYTDIYNSSEKVDLVIAYGGDGTVLAAMHYSVKYNAPLYAIESGTLGFLYSGKEEDFFNEFENILKGNFKTTKRALLDVKIGKENLLALNDVIITGEAGTMIHVKCKIDGQEITEYPADGVIVATATGSTAYTLSCGGPILDPEMKIFLVTPISSHTLSQRSILVKENSLVVLEAKEPSKLILDGQKKFDAQSCEISISEKYLELIKPSGKNFFDILKKKLHWGK